MINQIVEDVRQAKLKPSDLVHKAFEKIEEYKDLNIFTQVYKDQALLSAKNLENKIDDNQPIGRLAGSIFCIKDNFLTKDDVTTASAPFLTNFISPFTATCVQKLLDEDAILIGKANLDAFAHGTSTENSYFGPTKNPHDKTLTPGGSSGGSAVAVACDICHFSLGTDTGGSVRLPASFCGVFGFKPTYGMLSRYGVVAMASSTDCISPLARDLEDIQLLMDILHGRDDLDGTTINSSNLNFKKEELKGPLKLAVIEEFNTNLDNDVKSSFHQALDKLKSSSISIDSISISNINLALACYYILVSAEVSSNLSRYNGLLYGQNKDSQNWQDAISLSRNAGFMVENKRRIMLGTYVLSQGYYEAYYHKAQKLRTLLCSEFEKAFKQYDALISPVSPTTAFKLGSKIDNPVQMYLADMMTVAPSLAGIPALSLPLKSKVLPVGLQIMTKRGSDNFNLNIAQEVLKKI